LGVCWPPLDLAAVLYCLALGEFFSARHCEKLHNRHFPEFSRGFMGQQVQNYYPIFVYLVIISGFVITTLVLAHLPRVKPGKDTNVKSMPYESGMDPVRDARQHFDVKFYLVAILFLIFDVELLFLYPWAVSAYSAEGGIPIVFWSMIAFLSLVAIAYIYEWRRGGFRWH
jgi:NADH:ubiquinone oxidoreductase subunit 3 (subunit A)